MNKKQSKSNPPEADSLRYQLTELNNRARWYSSELWQIPFAYLGVTGVVIAQLAEKSSDLLGIGFAVSAIFGVFVIIHTFRIRANEQRSITYLQETEIALRLPITVRPGHGRAKILQIAVILTVLAYSTAAAYLLLR